MGWIADVIGNLKGWFYKMFTRDDFKRAIGADIAPTELQHKKIALWAEMYREEADWIDNKTVYSLNLPAAIASELARTAAIEMKLQITGSSRAEWLQEQIQPLIDDIRTDLETGLALGGLVWKPYPYRDGIAFSVIPADAYYPIRFDTNGVVQEAVFVDQRKVGDNTFTKFELHAMRDGQYIITNKAYKSRHERELGKQVPLDVIDDWAELIPEAIIQGADKLLFSYFKAPGSDPHDSNSPLGASCYAGAVGMIEQADRQFGRFLWEFESGERALYADIVAFEKDQFGNFKLPNKRLYKALNSSSNVGEGDLFREWTPTLREQNILNGLNSLYRKIEFSTGLAYGTLSDPEIVSRTATELKLAKQRTYATIKDIQRNLEAALDDLLWVMDFYATAYNMTAKGSWNAIFEFDDSVLVDRDSQIQTDRQAVSMGVMPKVEFLKRNYDLDEQEALNWIAQVQAETQTDIFP